MAWIYQEFAKAQNYDVTSNVIEDQHSAGGGDGMKSYDETLTRLLAGVLSRPDQREGLFSRLVLESPNSTTNAIQILKKYCQDEVCVHYIYVSRLSVRLRARRRPCMSPLY